MILESVPQQLVAGDTWRWTRAFSDYEAPTWVVTYYFENAAKQFSSAAAADGASHAVTISAVTSAALPAGRYRWYARAVSGSVVKTIEGENGWIEVLADPGATGTRDHRSWARRTLDAVEATLEGRATDGQKSMSIGGRTLERLTPAELMELRTQLRQEVRTEESGSNAGLGRNIKVRFGSA